MKEEWRWVDGYEGYYMVSNIGNVRSVKRDIVDRNGNNRTQNGRILKITRRSKIGYTCVHLSSNNISKVVSVHRLVAVAFLDNPHKKPEVNHKNLIKTDNTISNLEWCTSSENGAHAYNSGVSKPPSQLGKTDSLHHASKKVYKIDMCDNIVCVYESASGASRAEGISQGNISSVCRGERNFAGGYKWSYM